MPRRWLALLLCLPVCAGAGGDIARASLARQEATARTTPQALRVDERATRVSVDGEGRGRVTLAVENATGRALRARVTLELLDTKDRVAARDELTAALRAGRNAVASTLPVSNATLPAAEQRRFLWYRLRYRVAPVDPPPAAPAAGVVSLSEVTPDLFELRVAAPEQGREGQAFRVRARTTHPVSARPVPGVSVTAEVEFDDEGAPKLSSTAVTGADGGATFDFTLPAGVEDDEGDVTVTARRGYFAQKASDDFSLDRSLQFLITTDKPLYQPGQALRARALILDSSRRAVRDLDAVLKIEDEGGETVFRAPLRTSRFGVLSADWTIPEGARLGRYVVRVGVEEGRYEDAEGAASVRVSRYELPNFSVEAQPDRPYYLPGESALVEVRAGYLFGRPVRRARVKVVRETERGWNYKEQKYDVKEGARYEGEFDEEGRFRVRVSLADEHKELSENSWSRFADANFAAYVTDPTTNRTEQRRFSLRATRDPVHVYVTEGAYDQAGGLPLALYVSTYYPDGTPAECEVRISERDEDQAAGGGRARDGGRPAALLRTVRTNRYGVAKVTGPVLPRGETPGRNLRLLFEARDRGGRAGRLDEEFWLPEGRAVVRVETDKVIYAAGEPVVADIASDRPDLRLIVDAVAGGRALHTERVRLRGGRARLVVPYRPGFENRVQIVAYAADIPENSYDSYARGSRAVIYPRDRELKLDLRFGRETYEPGEEAAATAHVRTGAGRAAAAALGVVVFDKAVEERARTDEEFSSSYGFSDHFFRFFYGPESIGGVTLRDLEKLDPARPRPEGFDTVAELLLQRGHDYYSPNFFGGSGYDANQRQVFAALAATHLRPALAALDARYERTRAYPADEAALRRVLLESGVAPDSLLDPWGTPYRAEFTVERESDVLRFVSAGADEVFGSGDDWRAAEVRRPYFRATGELMSRAAEDHRRRTGTHLTGPGELKAELRRAHALDFDSLRDRWGRPYALRFAVSGTHYVFRVTSAGPDGRFADHPHSHGSDDFDLWTFSTDYFAEARALADAAIAAFHRSRGSLPKDRAQLSELLRAAGLRAEQLRDHWGRDYYATFRTEVRYADRVEGRAEGGAKRTEITPVTRRVEHVALRSAGPDGVEGTGDDFSAADFSAVASEQSAADREPRAAPAVTVFSGATGAITGTVTDPQGAAVAGATVTATHQQEQNLVFTAETGDDGKYLLRNLRSGLYTLRAQASGFKDVVVVDVPVRASALAQFDLQLHVGAITETVTVTAASDGFVNTTSATVTALTKGAPTARATAAQPPVTTPRLRKDFPETLYWQPELLTDGRGRASLKFKLADNITTWKVSAIASTESGELGTAEREVRAFRPFFAELDPPRVLTEGDEISLPVVLRNYLARPQRVALSIKPEDWFALLGPADKTAEIAAGDAARETFDLRATASVIEGRQRVTAVGADSSDAIERTVHVHPDGEEIAHTDTRLLGPDGGTLETTVPAEAVPRSARAELKIYPNLAAHAFESVEGVMSRPNGCGEQTVSAAYPSLLVLRHHARAGGSQHGAPVVAKARRYVQAGYERLLSYRTSDGGFAYWAGGEPDVALTAYALRFLRDASEFVAVDEDLPAGALRWLVSRQRADGSWPAPEWIERRDARRAALLTAYVARVLAEQTRATAPPARQQQAAAQAQPASQPPTPDAAAQQAGRGAASRTQRATEQTPLARALKFLAARAAETDEPYLLASYLLAAAEGDAPRAEVERAAARLRSLAREEGGAAYWSLETNTPFYGWGLAGRVETTALAVQALARVDCGSRMADCGLESSTSAKSEGGTSANPRSAVRDPQLISRGLLFLLRNKDRHGVWHSTQATVNVLDALMLLARTRDARRPGEERAEVFVNGRPAGALALPADGRAGAPLALDLTPFVGAGANRVEIRGSRNLAGGTAAQLVTAYYLPWQHSAADGEERGGARSSRTLRLAVSFDRTRAAVGEEIVCRVEAERVGHRGYGMLLAEVGLPPGADVDRATLERAMKEAGWGLERYDVLPDRLVLYLWPRAGGTRFSFSFRPRLGMRAKAAASQLYDYYNPEARAVLPPASFVVAERDQRSALGVKEDAPDRDAPPRR
jgi:hypothetical protein